MRTEDSSIATMAPPSSSAWSRGSVCSSTAAIRPGDGRAKRNEITLGPVSPRVAMRAEKSRSAVTRTAPCRRARSRISRSVAVGGRNSVIREISCPSARRARSYWTAAHWPSSRRPENERSRSARRWTSTERPRLASARNDSRVYRTRALSRGRSPGSPPTPPPHRPGQLLRRQPPARPRGYRQRAPRHRRRANGGPTRFHRAPTSRCRGRRPKS